MSELSIKVNIAGKTYPLTIKPEEEENIRKAARMINDNIKTLEENYAIRDKQDLLAMTALQFTTQLLESKSGTAESSEVDHRLKEINDALAGYLEKEQ